MWVKICGNTNLEDAALAAELGADAVGFVFAASKRQVTAAQVAAITMHLPEEVERIGVFDSHDAGEIAAVAQEAGLTAVQLHGGLDEKLLGAGGAARRPGEGDPDAALGGRRRERARGNRLQSGLQPRLSKSLELASPTEC